MAVNIRRVQIWRTEIQNRPGVLAATLEPLAQERREDAPVIRMASQ